MECCVGVSIETVLQVVKFYTVDVLKKNFKKLTFRTLVLRRSECMSYKQRGDVKKYNAMTQVCKKQMETKGQR